MSFGSTTPTKVMTDRPTVMSLMELLKHGHGGVRMDAGKALVV
jgi:hypothetical protein